MVTGTKKLFEKTEKAVHDFDEGQATDVMVKYQGLSSICESIVEDIIKSNGDSVPKSDVRLLMMARYTKRVNAHLKNVAETIKDPIQTISKCEC
jgi:phosphate uptake regulator